MTLVVETGASLSDAESFCSVAAADARRTAFGDGTAWDALETSEKEQALRKATAFMEQRYRQRWRGYKFRRDQALSWPRVGAEVDGYVLESNLVPSEVANVCADLALKSLSESLNADLTRGIVREKVGPLETEYDAYSPQGPRYPAIDQALAPFLNGGGAARVMRA
jgi:hypothetical protein